MNNIVIGYYADQGQPQDWGNSKQFSVKAGDLAYLTCVNKSGAMVYIELYDTEDGTNLGGLIPRVLPCADAGAGGFVGWSQLKMRRGIFVRAVGAVSGGSLIGGNDVKFDCGYMDR